MATLTPQTAVFSGITPTFNAVSASDKFDNDGRTYVHVVNGGASSDTVTIVTQQTVEGLAVADQTVAVANGTEKVIGPFKKSLFNDSAGQVTITHSYTTSVTMAVIQVPDAG